MWKQTTVVGTREDINLIHYFRDMGTFVRTYFQSKGGESGVEAAS